MEENEFEKFEDKRLNKKRKIEEFLEGKEKLRKYFDFLTKEKREKIEKNEIRKTGEQVEIIKGVNGIVGKISDDYQLDLYGISEKDIYFLPSNVYGEIIEGDEKKKRGIANFEQQEIFINENILNEKVVFASTILHEILHLNGILKCEENNDACIIREGLNIYVNPKNSPEIHLYGRDFEEAIILHLTRKYIPNILDLPGFEEEKDFSISEEFNKLKRKVSKEYEVSEEEIIWVDKKGRVDIDIHYKLLEDLDAYVKKIKDKFPEYKNNDEIFKEFVNSLYRFDQNEKYLMKIKELFDKTYEEGIFESLLILHSNYNIIFNNNNKLLKDFFNNKMNKFPL